MRKFTHILGVVRCNSDNARRSCLMKKRDRKSGETVPLTIRLSANMCYVAYFTIKFTWKLHGTQRVNILYYSVNPA